VKGIVSEVEGTVQQALSATDLDPGVKADLTDQFTASARSTALQFGGRDLLVLFGLFSVLTLAVNMLVVNSVTGNIQRLTAAVQGISKGEFEQDLSSLYSGKTTSEWSILAKAIEESGRALLREKKISTQVEKLQIQIDDVQRHQDAQAIMDTAFFRDLQENVKSIRVEIEH
jgi:hypothetical protein